MVVEHTPHHIKVEGSSQTTANSTVREKTGEKFQFKFEK
jgi:hypothetical protein